MLLSLSYYPELMLKSAGLHPYSKIKLAKFFYHHYINCFLFIFLLFLALLEVGVSLKSDIFRAIEGLSAVLFMTLVSYTLITQHWWEICYFPDILSLRYKLLQKAIPSLVTKKPVKILAPYPFLWWYSHRVW